MINVLKNAFENHNLVAVYTDRNDYDKFSVGFILSIVGEQYLIEHVSTRGEFDGYSVGNIDSIFRIEENSLYLKKIEKLRSQKGQNYIRCPLDISKPLVNSVLDYAYRNRSLVKMCISEDALDIIGYIVAVKNGLVKVLQISDYGNIDGESIFSIYEIIKLSILDLECMDLEILTQAT